MSDLVGNPVDGFSHNEAYIDCHPTFWKYSLSLKVILALQDCLTPVAYSGVSSFSTMRIEHLSADLTILFM